MNKYMYALVHSLHVLFIATTATFSLLVRMIQHISNNLMFETNINSGQSIHLEGPQTRLNPGNISISLYLCAATVMGLETLNL